MCVKYICFTYNTDRGLGLQLVQNMLTDEEEQPEQVNTERFLRHVISSQKLRLLYGSLAPASRLFVSTTEMQTA